MAERSRELGTNGPQLEPTLEEYGESSPLVGFAV
jgi:hypothetical protein